VSALRVIRLQWVEKQLGAQSPMVASEPILRAFLHVLYHVAIFVRLRSVGQQRLPDEHLFDLMDAIHNVPEFLTKPAGYFTVEKLRDHYFADYDAKWGKDGIGLIRLLNEGMELASNSA
jgi:hypothetical protein